MKTKGFGRTLLQDLMVAAIAVMINTGYWIRITETFGGRYSGAGFLNNILYLRKSTSTVPQLQPIIAGWSLR